MEFRATNTDITAGILSEYLGTIYENIPQNIKERILYDFGAAFDMAYDVAYTSGFEADPDVTP